MAERGITISYETIRLWCIKFGAKYAERLKRRHQGYGDIFYIDEVFVKINGKQHYLWRAVDQDGEVVDMYLQARRDGAAAKRFFQRLLRNHMKRQGWRAGNAAVQVDQAGSKIRSSLCCSIQFVQSGQAPCICWPLSKPQGKCVLRME